MCKLCNSDSPPIRSTKVLINIIAKDYIGTFPCAICAQALFKTQRYNPNKSLDDIIITKLYNKYRAFNYSQLSNSKQQAESGSSMFGIQPIFHRSTGQTVYKSGVNTIKGRVYLGLYPTLSEALEVKLKYMQEHGHTNGITNLTNKLKELSCN
ncbi:MAG: hypothetical protein ACMV1B_03425 [Prevotella sp.]